MAAPNGRSDCRSVAWFIDSPHQLDQPSERHEPKWESIIKEEISKFHGNLVPNIWICRLDHPHKTHLQDCSVKRANGKVNLTWTPGRSLHMVGTTPNQPKKTGQGQAPWVAQNEKEAQKFLPFKYVQTHYKSLHSQVRWFSRSMQTNPSFSSLRLVHPKLIMLILKPNLPTLARSLQYPMLNPIPPESELAN